MQTYEQFAKKHGVEFSFQHKGKRPMPDSKFKSMQDCYSCTLSVGMCSYDFPFYKGEGLKGEPPTAAETLYCLASDAHGTRDTSFEDWCREYGYDDDSRKAEATFDACCEVYTELEKLFGSEVLEELFYQTNEDGEE
jgi:hypothetical protein